MMAVNPSPGHDPNIHNNSFTISAQKCKVSETVQCPALWQSLTALAGLLWLDLLGASLTAASPYLLVYHR